MQSTLHAYNAGSQLVISVKGMLVDNPNIIKEGYARYILLAYLSITMHFNQSQYGATSFAAYSITACCTLMASISLHFAWIIQIAITEGCYAVDYYNCVVQN